jgi:hypothetical protein
LHSTDRRRLTAQWEERIHAAISSTSKEAERRLDELILTLRGPLWGTQSRPKEEITAYLQQVRDLLKTD